MKERIDGAWKGELPISFQHALLVHFLNHYMLSALRYINPDRLVATKSKGTTEIRLFRAMTPANDLKERYILAFCLTDLQLKARRVLLRTHVRPAG